jgi:zinc protease
MFKGTKKNPGATFSQTVAGLGGQENAFTSSDYTGYYQRVPGEHLARMMELEADRMTGLVLTHDVVRPELNVVLEEQNQRVANSPAAKLGEQVSAALYLNHPYGRPVIGWRNEIEKLTLEDALEFYGRFYGPNNAVVVIAGDVEPDQVRALAERTYGQVARRPDIAARMRPQEPDLRAVRSVTVADPRVEQPSVQRSYLAPSFATARRGESEALEVLAFVLGNGSNSRLYQSLVVDKRIAVGAGAWYQSTSLDASRFGVYASPRPGVELADLEKQLDAVIAAFIAEGLTPEELERAKTRLIADAIYAQDSQATLARWYGAALTTGAKVDDVRTWPERIRAITADDVRNAARAWLDKERSVTGYLIKSVVRRGEKAS